MFISRFLPPKLRLWIAFVLFSRACALTIPVSPDGLATAAPDPEPTILKLVHLSPRADTDVFTMFGSFDNSNVDKGVSDGESNLAPIEDVLQMMLTQAPPSPTVFTYSSLSMLIQDKCGLVPSYHTATATHHLCLYSFKMSTGLSFLLSPPMLVQDECRPILSCLYY